MQSSRREYHIEELMGWIGRAAIQAGSHACGGSGSAKDGDASSRKEPRKDTDTIPQSRNTIAETHDLSDELHTRAPRTHTRMYMFGLD